MADESPSIPPGARVPLPKTPPVPQSQTVPNTPEAIAIRERIVDRVTERAGDVPTCPMCHHDTFGVGAYVALPVTPNPTIFSLGQFMPAVTFVCTTCGNTLLINLLSYFTAEELAGMAIPNV